MATVSTYPAQERPKKSMWQRLFNGETINAWLFILPSFIGFFFFTRSPPFEVGIAKLPVSPDGRKTMFYGLADSIWVGSQYQDEAWQWVKFLGSVDCQNIVGSAGVVFPALQSGVDAAVEAYESRNVDVTPFTEEATAENGTFLFPITDYGAQIASILTNAMESIFTANAEVEPTLTQANEQINALFQ